MTDHEAFAAILEIARKHSLPIVPDGWVKMPADSHYAGRYLKCEEVGPFGDVQYNPNPKLIDLQALTGVLGPWLEKEHRLVFLQNGDGYAPFELVSGARAYRHMWHQINYVPTRLQAQLAALRHVTGEKE